MSLTHLTAGAGDAPDGPLALETLGQAQPARSIKRPKPSPK